jgi:hypothetical protein
MGRVTQTARVGILDLGRGVQHSWCSRRPEIQGFYPSANLNQAALRVFDDELNRIAREVGSREKAFKLAARLPKNGRFFLPLKPENPDDTVC